MSSAKNVLSPEEEIAQIRRISQKLNERLTELEELQRTIEKVSSNRNPIVESVLFNIESSVSSTASVDNEKVIHNNEDSSAKTKEIALINTCTNAEEQTSFNENTVNSLFSETDLPPEITEDIFKGLTAHKAVVKYLKIMKYPQSVREIVNGLLKGGYVTKSEDLYDSILPLLRRNYYPRGSREFILIGRKWDLAERHDEMTLQKFGYKNPKSKS